MLRAQSNANAASSLASGTEAAASSGFLKNYGNYVGGTLSIMWTSLAIYSAYLIVKLKPDSKNPYFWAGPGILGLLVLVANVYYISNKNKGNEEDEQSVKSTYANITLVPFYIVILGLGFAVIFNKRRY